jgi:NAD(P)-dependent dehydrogenase (short-subunit alcohol dehydrogenase family)
MTIAIITGGSRGLGRSTALQCAARGSGVILTYNSHPEGADAVVRAIEADGGKAVALKLDVSDTGSFPEFKQAVVTALAQTWGRTTFDHFVNNAGYGLFKSIATVTEDEFDGLFAVHLKGPFFLTQTLLPLMADGGAIVNVTSAPPVSPPPALPPMLRSRAGSRCSPATWPRSSETAASAPMRCRPAQSVPNSAAG